MKTYICSGEQFDVLNPDESNYTINDIAHALSNLCRFGGHTSVFYSVAQHSVMVSKIVPKEYALEGLLHDASEAFLGDVVRPLKRLLPDYSKIEEKVQTSIALRFGLCAGMADETKDADDLALMNEFRVLMPEAYQNAGYSCRKEHGIYPVEAEFAKALFLMRYQEITTCG